MTDEVTYEKFSARATMFKSLRRNCTAKSLQALFRSTDTELMNEYFERWKKERFEMIQKNRKIP